MFTRSTLFALFASLTAGALCAKNTFTISSFQKESPDSYHAALNVMIPEGDALYADYIMLSVDTPHLTLSPWHASAEPVSKFDPYFKTSKRIYTKPFQIEFDAKLDDPTLTQATLHVSYYLQSAHKNNEALFALPLSEQEIAIPQENSEITATPIACQKETPKPHSISSYVSALLEKSDSLWLKLLLSFLLGIFLSLTPCIYPMIPITMGILQSQASKSVLRNFSLALTYTLGIATTFAMLGVTAAFTGQMFGTIMNNPFVIIAIVLMLLYLAGSMLGFYEMYIPRGFQNGGSHARGGSYLAAFLFGAASGTIASPCLSPGLVLLLTLVTGIGSIWIGFALLFCFGFGLGIPLLIIGTFSGSLNMLPRAGVWMVDIKEFFGFIMIGTCFYFLSSLVPAYLLAWAASLFILSVGIFYLRASGHATGTRRTVKSVLGVLFVAFAIYSLFTAYKTTELNASPANPIWICDYQDGLARAQQEKKLVLLDISAPYCSICKAIERKHFADSGVQEALAQFITIKIDDIEKDECTKALQTAFHILGAPTLILFDPATNREIKRWGGELYDLSPIEFVRELSSVRPEPVEGSF